MGRYDYFVGHLECPHCGAMSANDSSTGMQTYLRDPEDPYAPEVYLGVGDALGDIDTQEFTWSYRTIQEFAFLRIADGRTGG